MIEDVFQIDIRSLLDLGDDVHANLRDIIALKEIDIAFTICSN